MPDSRAVYLSRNGYADSYHLRDDCSYLPDDDARVRETTERAVASHYSLCSVCKRDAENQSRPAPVGVDSVARDIERGTE